MLQEGAKAVIERAVRILVGSIGMGDRGQLHDRVRRKESREELQQLVDELARLSPGSQGRVYLIVSDRWPNEFGLQGTGSAGTLTMSCFPCGL